MARHELKGDFDSGRVWLDDIELSLEDSLKFRNHSPSGFSWGYMGSGPSQLALAVCLRLYGLGEAEEVYQEFKVRRASKNH